MNVYDRIGSGYNTTRIADPYIFERLCELLLPQDDKLYVDIGCGTGNYTCVFAEKGYNFIGIDPSPIMLAEAVKKSDKVKWLSGSAEGIPLDDDTVDGVIATFTVHHWDNLEIGFREIARVIKDTSLMVLLTFTPEQERGYWLNHYFPVMMSNSINRDNTFDVMAGAAADAGFSIQETQRYFVREDLADMFCYAGKHNPEIYFDPSVRAGISSFALWPDETDRGLSRLRRDIDTGDFLKIKEKYENSNGDYLFVVLKLLKK